MVKVKLYTAIANFEKLISVSSIIACQSKATHNLPVCSDKGLMLTTLAFQKLCTINPKN